MLKVLHEEIIEAFPKDAKECKEILSDAFDSAKDGTLTKEAWEIFSGRFNRHIHSITPTLDTSEKELFQYVFVIWQSMRRQLNLREQYWSVFQRSKEENHYNKLLALFQEKLDGLN